MGSASGFRKPSFRYTFHRAVLHNVKHMDGTRVLRLWFPFRRHVSSGHSLCRGVSGDDVHAPLRGGFPMVVEIVLRLRICCRLYLPLLYQLPRFRSQKPQWSCFRHSLPRLLPFDGSSSLIRHRHSRLSLFLLVRPLPFLLRQARLVQLLNV